MEFTEQQKKAIELCCDLEKRIVSVTGGAGTGKTTIIKEVYKRLIEDNKTVIITAPTGKASKRITEATGIEAITIHRLLEFPQPDEKKGINVPSRVRRRPLDQDVIIVDEYAMVNVELHDYLFDAIKNGGVVRCFGDLNQLEPIETDKYWKEKPSRFRYLLEKFPSVTLDKIHRQGEGSDIIFNANKIINGEVPIEKINFRIFKTTNQNALEYVNKIIKDDKEYFTNSKQILTCQNTGFIGTRKLNVKIQEYRYGLFNNTDKCQIIERSQLYDDIEMKLYVGDKIIMTKNDYNVGFLNGESGIITDFYDSKVVVNLGDREVIVPPIETINVGFKTINYNPQIYIDLGYVITTHKSQGSEYGEIMYLLDKSGSYMQCKQNFYTAVTRAKDKVIVVADNASLKRSVK